MPNISGKINVSLVSKERLFKGEKGTYLDIALIETPNGQYGDFLIVESLTKEERQADPQRRGTILGNAKYFGQKGSGGRQQPRQQSRPTQSDLPPPEDGDSVPF